MEPVDHAGEWHRGAAALVPPSDDDGRTDACAAMEGLELTLAKTACQAGILYCYDVVDMFFCEESWSVQP